MAPMKLIGHLTPRTRREALKGWRAGEQIFSSIIRLSIGNKIQYTKLDSLVKIFYAIQLHTSWSIVKQIYISFLCLMNSFKKEKKNVEIFIEFSLTFFAFFSIDVSFPFFRFFTF